MTLWQYAETFLKWITPALGGSAVKELTFHFYGLHTPGSLRDTAVVFVGSRIVRSVTDVSVLSSDGLPLSGFTALERLTLNLYLYTGNWDDVASALQEISSNTIQSITFDDVYTIRAGNNDADLLSFDHDTLEALDRVLSCELFGSLQEVIFKVDVYEQGKQDLLRAHARRCLPELHKRNIIALNFNVL
ncbi:hypothetical protein L226DRAFT_51543 [Lentinus tigrinus ALCF2SS1-7]|uniref:uncharacterized protein n=1 Tax=Lentinus tigrinus ALCF2SS1-7 TaxID=1328758 RepID=UPI001165D320|nr:hypothetical protein L226DRAFT_51543 [Lentinus tigrinus ALCF2SS1-7]